MSEKSKSEIIPTVCIDLDGVLAHYDHWRGGYHIGEPNPEGVRLVRMLREVGVKVVIFTCRLNHAFPDEFDYQLVENNLIQWLVDNDLSFCELYTGVGKPFAHAYVDDRGVYFGKNSGPADEAFEAVMRLLPEPVL